MRAQGLSLAVLSIWMLSEATAFAAPPPPPQGGTERKGPPRSPTKQRNYLGDDGGDPTVGSRTTEEDHTGAWAYATGSEEEAPNYVRPAEEKAAQLKVNPIGYYQGVSVAGENLPPFAPQEISTGASVLTWTGFERGNGVSRVFFQLSSAVAPEESADGSTLTYRLPNTSVNVRNNKRALDTRFFPRTPVTNVKIQRSGADTIIKINLRRDTVPQTSVVAAPNGYTMFVIEFADLAGGEA
jgi:hypothetical protein